VVTSAYPRPFQNGQEQRLLLNNKTEEDNFGWYAPIAMILAPLPTKSRAVGNIQHQQIDLLPHYGPGSGWHRSPPRWSSSNLRNYYKAHYGKTRNIPAKYSIELSYLAESINKGNRRFSSALSGRPYHDDSHEYQWSRMMWSLMKTGAVYLPKKAVSNLNAVSNSINRRPIASGWYTASDNKRLPIGLDNFYYSLWIFFQHVYRWHSSIENAPNCG
jgi:hypothetical protein